MVGSPTIRQNRIMAIMIVLYELVIFLLPGNIDSQDSITAKIARNDSHDWITSFNDYFNRIVKPLEDVRFNRFDPKGVEQFVVTEHGECALLRMSPT